MRAAGDAGKPVEMLELDGSEPVELQVLAFVCVCA